MVLGSNIGGDIAYADDFRVIHEPLQTDDRILPPFHIHSNSSFNSQLTI
jgi:hypothetical protein